MWDALSVLTPGYAVLEDNFSPAINGVVAWKRMGASPDTTVVIDGSVGGSSNGVAASAIVLRGVHLTTPIDATTTVTTNFGTNPDPPSITTVTDGAAVVVFMGAGVNDSSITVPSGYGNLSSINSNDSLPVSSAVAWRLKSPAGSENPPAFTGVSSGDWSALTVALRPAPAPGSPWYYYAQLQ